MRSVSRCLKRRNAVITRRSSSQRHDFGTQFVDEHLPRHRLPFGDPQQVVRFGVGDQQIAEILAGREDLQQDRQRFPIALEQRGQRKRIAAAATKRSRLLSAMSASLSRGNCSASCSQIVRQQVERDARQRGAHQAGVSALDIV